MPSKSQHDVIYAIEKYGVNANIHLKKSEGAIQANLSRFFERFYEDLKIVDEHFNIFEGRFKLRPESYSLLRRLARKIKK